MNTRTVLLWHNNGEERIYFTVNPAEINVSRPNQNRVLPLAMGGTVNAWGGRGLREVKLRTFLPCEGSPFYSGQPPEAVLAMLCRWQDSGDPVRLILSESDINDAFLIEDVTETFREGDKDTGLTLSLREYKFKSALAALAGESAPPDPGGRAAVAKDAHGAQGRHAVGNRLPVLRRRDEVEDTGGEKRRGGPKEIADREGAGIVGAREEKNPAGEKGVPTKSEDFVGRGGRKEAGGVFPGGGNGTERNFFRRGGAGAYSRIAGLARGMRVSRSRKKSLSPGFRAVSKVISLVEVSAAPEAAPPETKEAAAPERASPNGRDGHAADLARNIRSGDALVAVRNRPRLRVKVQIAALRGIENVRRPGRFRLQGVSRDTEPQSQAQAQRRRQYAFFSMGSLLQS